MADFKKTVMFAWNGGKKGESAKTAESIIRLLKSKLTHKRGVMMWQIKGIDNEEGLFLDIHIYDEIKRVCFVEAQDGTFTSYVYTHGDRPMSYNDPIGKRMFGKQCAYCRDMSIGGDKIVFNRCSLCDTEIYCSKNCQSMAWVIDHRVSCPRDVCK